MNCPECHKPEPNHGLDCSIGRQQNRLIPSDSISSPTVLELVRMTVAIHYRRGFSDGLSLGILCGVAAGLLVATVAWSISGAGVFGP